MSWAPFNSVINNNDITNEILDRYNNIKQPEYNEEQLEELEYKIMKAYNSKSNICIHFYKNYKNNSTEGIITKIDSIHKNIVLNNKISIYFYNILSIDEKNTC